MAKNTGAKAKAEADAKAKAEADAKAKAEAKAAAPVEAKADAKAKKPPYYMAEGKALTSKKGILGPGDEVKAEYFTEGQKTVDARVESGHVIKA